MSGTSSDQDAVRSACHAAPSRPSDTRRLGDVFNRGVWKENPVLVQALGLCPALAVTNTVANSLAMGLATFFVLTSSSVLVSLLKNVIPNAVRISAYVLIIGTFVTVVDIVMQATVPTIHKALGAFIFLIVVNCMILSRQEAFAAKQPVFASLVDAAGTGVGFILALLLMGTIREVMGAGSVLGIPVLGPRFEPWVVMALPPGGFFTIGFILLGMNAWQQRGEAKKPAIRRWPHGVASRNRREAA